MHARDGAYIMRPERIADFEGTLRSHYARERRLVRSAFTFEGKPVDVAVGRTPLCCTRLDRVVINTQFAQVGEFMVPVFAPSGLLMTLEWPVPADMELRFASVCEQAGGHWKMGECYLFARKTGRPGFLRLPLPNLFDDGRVCMGDLVVGTVRGETVSECFAAAALSFRTTRWNSDIAPDQGRTRALFRWRPDRSPVPPPADWERYCYTVSRTEMEELCPT